MNGLHKAMAFAALYAAAAIIGWREPGMGVVLGIVGTVWLSIASS